MLFVHQMIFITSDYERNSALKNEKSAINLIDGSISGALK